MSYIIYLNNARRPNMDDVIEELLHFHAQSYVAYETKNGPLCNSMRTSRNIRNVLWTRLQDGRMVGGHENILHVPTTPAVSCVASWWDYRNRENWFQSLPQNHLSCFLTPKKTLRPISSSMPRIANASRTCSCPATVMASSLPLLVNAGAVWIPSPTKKVTIKKEEKRKSESLIVFLTLLVPSGLHAYFASNGPGNWVTWSKKILRT